MESRNKDSVLVWETIWWFLEDTMTTERCSPIEFKLCFQKMSRTFWRWLVVEKWYTTLYLTALLQDSSKLGKQKSSFRGLGFCHLTLHSNSGSKTHMWTRIRSWPSILIIALAVVVQFCLFSLVLYRSCTATGQQNNNFLKMDQLLAIEDYTNTTYCHLVNLTRRRIT